MGTTPPPEPDPEIVEQWLRMSRDDLAVAEVVLATTPTARWAACFHGQQAVEKAMKALLVVRAVDFPKTHSLGYLGGLLGETGRLLDDGIPEGAAAVGRRRALSGRCAGAHGV